MSHVKLYGNLIALDIFLVNDIENYYDWYKGNKHLNDI